MAGVAKVGGGGRATGWGRERRMRTRRLSRQAEVMQCEKVQCYEGERVEC